MIQIAKKEREKVFPGIAFVIRVSFFIGSIYHKMGERTFGMSLRYLYEDVHACRMKLIEVIPGKKVVCQVVANYFILRRIKANALTRKSF